MLSEHNTASHTNNPNNKEAPPKKTTSDRKQREFASREQLFLDKAIELIQADGFMNLQMSRLAAKAEYSTGTLYQHFSSKEDLLLALTNNMLIQRTALFEHLATWDVTPREKLMGMGMTEMIATLDNPQFFKIAQLALTEAVWERASIERRDAIIATYEPTSKPITDVIQLAVDNGDLDPGKLSIEEISLGFWSLSVGLHNLAHTAGTLEWFNIHEPYKALSRHFNHLLNGFNWAPIIDPNDDEWLKNFIEKLVTEMVPHLADTEALKML